MKKIRSEFLSEHEANAAIEKISQYCGNARILYYDENFNYSPFQQHDRFYGFHETSALDYGSFGSFGIIGGWHFNPHVLSDNYNRDFYQPQPGRTTLEADVSDDNFEYVKDSLYSLGALTVT